MKNYNRIIKDLSDKLSTRLRHLIESDNIESDVSVAISQIDEMISHYLLIGDIDTYEELISVANNLSNKSGSKLYRYGIDFTRSDVALTTESHVILSSENGGLILM